MEVQFDDIGATSEDFMTTFYPMDFHRRVDRRWAERMNSASADAQSSMVLGRRLSGKKGSPKKKVPPKQG
jgi:hypothetical protein